MPQDTAEAERLEEEQRLVERAQAGDMDALRPLFERYSDPLYGGVILPRLGDTAAAQDVLRDTFASAIEKIGTFQWSGRSIYAWLRQIAVNKVIDVHRRTKRTGRLVSALAEEQPQETSPWEAPDEALIAVEEQRRNAGRIEAAMTALSPRYRLAIQLRLVEERPREECAQRLNVTIGTFDVVLFRAIRAFRRAFGEPEES